MSVLLATDSLLAALSKAQGGIPWAGAHGPADRRRRDVEAAFLLAIKNLRDSAERREAEAKLLAGDVKGALAAIHWPVQLAKPLEAVLLPILREIAQATGTAAGAEPPFTGQLAFSFNLRDPGFLRAVAEHGAAMVREVTEETRQALREVIAQAYRDGLHPHRFAKLVTDHIGLDTRRHLAVLHYRQGLVAAGRTEEQADAMAGRYAERLLRQRAETIARHETVQAASIGRMDSFRQGIDRGLVDGRRAKLRWLTAEDERVCPYCAPLDMAEIPWGDAFHTLLGAAERPPLHVVCRCVTVLIP